MLYCVIQKTEFMLFSIMLFASPLLVLAYLYIHVEFIYLILRYFYNCALKCWIQINVCAATCSWIYGNTTSMVKHSCEYVIHDVATKYCKFNKTASAQFGMQCRWVCQVDPGIGQHAHCFLSVGIQLSRFLVSGWQFLKFRVEVLTTVGVTFRFVHANKEQ